MVSLDTREKTGNKKDSCKKESRSFISLKLLKHFGFKNDSQENSRKPLNRRKYSRKDLFEKGLLSNIYKELLRLNNKKKQTTPAKKKKKEKK